MKPVRQMTMLNRLWVKAPMAGRRYRRVASRWLLQHGARTRRGRLGAYLWDVGCYVDERRGEA